MTQWHDGTTLDDQLVAAWHRLKPERQKIGRSPVTGLNGLETALSWLRKYPGVCLRVMAEDIDAASIAVRMRWTIGPAPHPTSQEIARAERAARQAIEAIHGSHVANNVIPLRAAASTVKPEVRRGPPLDDPDA